MRNNTVVLVLDSSHDRVVDLMVLPPLHWPGMDILTFITIATKLEILILIPTGLLGGPVRGTHLEFLPRFSVDGYLGLVAMADLVMADLE